MRSATSVFTSLAMLSLATSASLRAQGSDQIRVNQVGYYPAAPKVAIVADTVATRFVVVRAERGDAVLRGALSAPRAWAPSGETVRTADFSGLRAPGRYALVVPGVGRSHPFAVDTAAVREVARAAVKAFYYQRTAVPLLPEHAGRWARPAGHPDTLVLVHPSAADSARPAGTVIRAPLGWYDAGDYNKYVVNSGISTYTLMAIAEHFPEYAARLGTNIPESGNALPDVVDEALFNLRWMLAMQDPRDGGVYHKLTNPEFEGMVMPHEASKPRYVVQKSTAATLDLAATAAHAARVLRRMPGAPRALVDSLVRVVMPALRWAGTHHDSLYDQGRLNRQHDPDVNTGAYGDRRLDDERGWSEREVALLARVGEPVAGASEPSSRYQDLVVPSWPSVHALGDYSALAPGSPVPPAIREAMSLRVVALADSLVGVRRANPYGVPMTARDFVWGSNAVAANQGMLFVQAYRVTGDTAYLNAAGATLDYLLGANPTGYSFVTGHGARTPMFPHHRPSESDGIREPVPGFLVGGPNPGMQDKCPGYPSKLPALAYVDSTCSYAANEIAINWNAPLAYLAAAVDAVRSSPLRVRKDDE